MDKENLKEQTERLLELHREITDFYNNYAKSVGMTNTSLEILRIIWEERANTQKMIAKFTGTPKQTVNAIIQYFNKLEIIEPLIESNNDKRNKVIVLTEKGKLYAQKIISKVQECEYKALYKLGEDKIKDLIDIITLYNSNLKIE